VGRGSVTPVDVDAGSSHVMAVDSQIPLQILPNPHRSLPHPQLKCIGGRGKTKRNNNGMNQIRRK